MSAPYSQAAFGPAPVQATYKAREVESLIDIYFYRPVGFYLALWSSRIHLTPSGVTAIGALFGLAAGHLYYYSSLGLNLAGMLLHIIANALDNADGQLARLTGKGSRLGRMNDSFADHVIFIGIYAHLGFRYLHEGGTPAIALLALAAGACHAFQGGVADFVRNAHLFFTSAGTRGDFEPVPVLARQFAGLTWRREPWHKLLLLLHVQFTRRQERIMPALATLRDAIMARHAAVPAWFAAAFRLRSAPLLKWVNLIMTNPRMLVLFAVLALGRPAWFFIAQLTIFNLFTAYLLWQLARACRDLLVRVEAGETAAP